MLPHCATEILSSIGTPQLHSKGRLEVGACADVLVMTADYLEPKYVIAKGVLMKTPDWVRGGCFERGEGIRPCPVPTL
jgi:hypothetical protein